MTEVENKLVTKNKLSCESLFLCRACAGFDAFQISYLSDTSPGVYLIHWEMSHFLTVVHQISSVQLQNLCFAQVL